MGDADSFKIAPPDLKLRMTEGHCIDPSGGHERMLGGILAMHVEFLLQQGIYSRVEAEGKTRGTADTKTSVEVETAFALLEELNLTAAQGEERLLSRSVELGETCHGVVRSLTRSGLLTRLETERFGPTEGVLQHLTLP